MEKYLEVYIREMKNRNYARNTIKIYSKHVENFLEFGRKLNFNPKTRISVFLNSELKTNEQRRLAWSSIRLFYKLVLQKECPYKLDKVRSRKRLPDVLANDEVMKILCSIYNNKHKLLISTLYGSGLRVSEVCNIKIKDVNIKDLSLRIHNSKGNKDRLTVISEKSVPGLMLLMNNRRAEEYLFVTRDNKKYSRRTVQKIFSDALERSGLQRSPTCHTLRHCFATHLVESGVDIKTVKGLLGHKSIKTTMIYVNLADPISRKIKSPL